MRKHNWHPKLIEDYLEKYYKNIDSRDTARVYLKAFFTEMELEPKRLLQKSKDDITKIIWDFAKKIESRPPKTQISMLSFIKKFLIRYKKGIDEVEFEDIQIRNNLKRKVQPITKKKTPTVQELKKILSHATSIKTKCLFVLCASSGLRIDEALSLTWDDIDLDNRSIELVDEVAKFDARRYTFFTPEAKELLELWIPEREKLLQFKHKKSKYLREKLKKEGYEVERVLRTSSDSGEYYTWVLMKDGKKLSKEEVIKIDNRIFPFDYVNAHRMWTTLLEKIGTPFNEIDNNPKLKFKKYLYNEHCLRRFWFTQLASDRANEEFVNFIGGHTSDLSKTYKDFDSEIIRRKIKEEYDKHIGCLSIFEALPDLAEHTEEINKLKTDNERLKEEMAEMKAQILELRLEKLEQQNGIKPFKDRKK